MRHDDETAFDMCAWDYMFCPTITLSLATSLHSVYYVHS